MEHKVKHFSLHRIGETELRVISDVEDGVLPVIEVEESVIRNYIKHGLWNHQWVTLFVLKDLKSLVRHLNGAADALSNQPLVNVYDLADLSGCRIFINWESMTKGGYQDDLKSMRALLAHEHAHCLSECPATSASRKLKVELKTEYMDFVFDGSQTSGYQQTLQLRHDNVLNLMAHKLCLYAPREILANEITIRSGFEEALIHLNRRNIVNARASVAGREDIKRHLQQEGAQGNLTRAAVDLLLLIGDLQSYAELALETAPFYRSGQERSGRRLEEFLEDEVFLHLDPEAPRAYTALVKQYMALKPNMTQDKLLAWCEGVLDILAKALAAKGLLLHSHLEIAN